MKIRKLLHILIVPSLLCGCSNEVPAKNESESIDKILPNNANKKEDDSDNQPSDNDRPKDSGDQKTEPPDGTMETGPLTINNVGCEPLGEFMTAIRSPHYASIDSPIVLEAFIGHAWRGTDDFSYVDKDYLQWKYSLRMCYEKGKAKNELSDSEPVWTKLMELDDYNTDIYNIGHSGDYSITFYAYETIQIDKELLQLSEDEYGSICFYISITDSQNQTIDDSDLLNRGYFCLPVYFMVNSSRVRFESFMFKDFYS